MAYFRCGNGNSGGGGELTETLMWENSNWTSDWSPGYATFSEPFTNYKYLKFVYKYRRDNMVKDNATSTEIICSTEDFAKGSNQGFSCTVYNSGYYIRLTYYYDSSDTKKKAYISECVKLGTSTTSNAYLIPYQIYGLK